MRELAIGVAALLLVGGDASAVTLCVKKKGAVVARQECRRGETALTVEGDPGPPGPAGARGDQGPIGPPGPAGGLPRGFRSAGRNPIVVPSGRYAITGTHDGCTLLAIKCENDGLVGSLSTTVVSGPVATAICKPVLGSSAVVAECVGSSSLGEVMAVEVAD